MRLFLNIYDDKEIKTAINKLNNRDVPKLIYEDELPVEYQFHANILREKRIEIEEKIREESLNGGLPRDIVNGIYFNISYINVPMSSEGDLWTDESGNLLTINPDSFLDSLRNIFVIFIRVYSWTNLCKEDRAKLANIASNSISSWMGDKGLTKGKGGPHLHL